MLPDGTLIGYGYVGWTEDADQKVVWGYGWGTVHPAYRRRGVGRQIMQQVDAFFAGKTPGDQL